MTIRHHGVLALTALLALPLLTGCGSKEDVLAVIGDRTITVDQFKQLARGNEQNYPADPDSARKLVLDDMVRRELLLTLALHRGLDQDPLALNVRESAEERLLVQALYLELAPPNLPVSDSEIERFHAWRDSAAHMFVIYTPDRTAADAALERLELGEDFADVANRYNVPGMMPGGGDLGFRVSGDLVDPLDEQIRVARVGELVGPLEAPTEGWFIMKIVERQPRDQQPLEEARLELTEMIRQRKQRALATKTYTNLRDQYEITMEQDGPQFVFGWYNQALSRSADGGPAGDPTDEELSTVLARYKGADGTGQTYTFADMQRDMSDRRRQQPNLTLLPAIVRWVEGQIVRRAAYIEARKRKLQDDPDVARSIAREVEAYLADGIFADEITLKVAVDEDDVRAAYERRKDEIQESYEGMSPGTQRALYNEAVAIKSDERFRAVTDSIRQSLDRFELHEEKLATIPWPIPAENAP